MWLSHLRAQGLHLGGLEPLGCAWAALGCVAVGYWPPLGSNDGRTAGRGTRSLIARFGRQRHNTLTSVPVSEQKNKDSGWGNKEPMDACAGVGN
jgi:hypothetical protein